ncbi:MAG: alpha-galactosidase [Bullifex sp.]
MKETRICIIGGGSRLWAIGFFRDLAFNKMTHGTVVLHDINHQAALNNVCVGERTMKLNGSEGRFAFISEDNLEKALEGADLVIISIEPGDITCRKGDLVTPEEYGIYQSVGDTTGPGGIMRARRAIPLFLGFAEAIKKVCPDAWVINYTNPMTLCTAALFRGFPGIKALGCCHEVFHTETFIAELVEKWFDVPRPDRREIHVDITGVNHFTWVTGAVWNGIDLMPRLRKLACNPETYRDRSETAKERIAKEEWFDSDHIIALSLLRDFGALGAAGDRHLAEFVPWYLTDDESLHRYGVVRTPYRWRTEEDKRKKEKIFTDEELIATLSDEEGVDIMRSLMGDRTLYTTINRPNEGQISFLPKGRIVESNGFISQDSIRPIVSSDPPLAVQNMIRQVSDTQQMVLDAVCDDDDGLLFAAFLSDPLVNIQRDKARELFDRMLKECVIRY